MASSDDAPTTNNIYDCYKFQFIVLACWGCRPRCWRIQSILSFRGNCIVYSIRKERRIIFRKACLIVLFPLWFPFKVISCISNGIFPLITYIYGPRAFIGPWYIIWTFKLGLIVISDIPCEIISIAIQNIIVAAVPVDF